MRVWCRSFPALETVLTPLIKGTSVSEKGGCHWFRVCLFNRQAAVKQVQGSAAALIFVFRMLSS